jgi:hypothetical protein
MRNAAIVLLLLVVAGTASAATRPAKPSLRIVDVTPVTAAGRWFRPNEKVRLMATSAGVATKVVRADSRGRFATKLDVRAVLCRGLVIQAFGARGSRAHVSVDATECGPSLDPNLRRFPGEIP